MISLDFSCDDDLAQRQLVLRRPRRDHVDRRPTRSTISGPAESLAVDRHDAVLGQFLHSLDPAQQALLERRGVEPGQDAPEGVLRGDAIAQVEVAGEPAPPVAGELVDPRDRVGAGEDAADGHEDDIDQRMLAGPLHTRVVEILEVLLE